MNTIAKFRQGRREWKFNLAGREGAGGVGLGGVCGKQPRIWELLWGLRACFPKKMLIFVEKLGAISFPGFAVPVRTAGCIKNG